MPFDRLLWKRTFLKDYVPPWPCPSCAGVGTLRPSRTPIDFAESGESRDAHEEHDWYPDQIEGKFAGLLDCGAHGCGETIAVAGTYHLHEVFDEVASTAEWEPQFQPTFFLPAPPMFPIPRACPVAVSGEINAAFALYWCDAGASMNRFRSAVEAMLTDLRVARSAFTGKPGKRRGIRRLTLKERIAKLPASRRGLAERLDAIRWMGNAGSHSKASVTQDHVLDVVEILEHVLQEHYGRRDQAVRDLTRRINRQKGPGKP